VTAPELSVVIVSYRCAGHLDHCLRSIEGNAQDVSLEVIVVDNASGDSTAGVARQHAGTHVLERGDNAGFARAANQGMALARGRAVLVLNPDTTVPPGALRACLDALWGDPRMGILTPRVVDEHGHIDARCHRAFPTAWSALCFLTGLDRVLPWRSAQAYTMRWLPDDRPADVDAVSGAFMLMRADALHQVGGFDQQFFMYAEDIDLCMRMRCGGWRVIYWPHAAVTHLGGGSTDDDPFSMASAAAHRTVAPLIRKHRPGMAGALAALLALVGGEALLSVRRVRYLLRHATAGPRSP
jgi:N-acetylglucosaminyl-diphospho-decaprenol L-rhamnosyltransferase